MSPESTSKRTVVPAGYVWPNIIRASSKNLCVMLPVMSDVVM